jgi:hypothetical protein
MIGLITSFYRENKIIYQSVKNNSYEIKKIRTLIHYVLINFYPLKFKIYFKDASLYINKTYNNYAKIKNA